MKDAMYVNQAGNFCGYQQLLSMVLTKSDTILKYVAQSYFVN